jgi:hypothetical protein
MVCGKAPKMSLKTTKIDYLLKKFLSNLKQFGVVFGLKIKGCGVIFFFVF